jgi:hypothetical protein
LGVVGWEFGYEKRETGNEKPTLKRVLLVCADPPAPALLAWLRRIDYTRADLFLALASAPASALLDDLRLPAVILPLDEYTRRLLFGGPPEPRRGLRQTFNIWRDFLRQVRPQQIIFLEHGGNRFSLAAVAAGTGRSYLLHCQEPGYVPTSSSRLRALLLRKVVRVGAGFGPLAELPPRALDLPEA